MIVLNLPWWRRLPGLFLSGPLVSPDGPVVSADGPVVSDVDNPECCCGEDAPGCEDCAREDSPDMTRGCQGCVPNAWTVAFAGITCECFAPEAAAWRKIVSGHNPTVCAFSGIPGGVIDTSTAHAWGKFEAPGAIVNHLWTNVPCEGGPDFISDEPRWVRVIFAKDGSNHYVRVTLGLSSGGEFGTRELFDSGEVALSGVDKCNETYVLANTYVSGPGLPYGCYGGTVTITPCCT